MAAVFIRPAANQKSRLRLVVVQALVAALFLTLFARLWYVQVYSGQTYRAQAAEQSVREVVVQPPRGLIVDDMGRPLVANRTSWVVSVDRTLLHRLSASAQKTVLARVAHTVRMKYARVYARTLTCGEKGSRPGTCWNGSPFQPVPIAEDVPQATAVSILERSEDFPSVLAESQSVRAYPAPYGVNLAQELGYLSTITQGELAHAHSQHDSSLNAASVVGRAGLERRYDDYLRGQPGYQRVAVNSLGQVLGNSGTVKARPGDTLVTSIDAKVQGVVEQQLAQTIKTARHTYDPVTHRNYVADSGAVVVLDAKNGRVVALASQPTYHPSVWVGGITTKQLDRLYSARSGLPLLSRAFQGQFAPGSTWKPEMTVAAFSNGFGPNSRLDCSSGLQVGNRLFKNYESQSYGPISFAKALQVSCDTFFYRVGLALWQRYGSNPANINARDPLVKQAQSFGYGRPTGIDLPGEAAGRIADRHWKYSYWKAMKAYYCKLDKHNQGSAFLQLFAHEFCLGGYTYTAGDAVNFAVGQGDTVVTPLQLARAYAAISNDGTLFEPRIGKAIVDPAGNVVKRIVPPVQAHVKGHRAAFKYVDAALQGTPKTGTLAWKFINFPLDKVHLRGKTGSAEVYGKQSTSWVATYTKDYVVVMMVTQAGTGSGTSGPAVRKIWETLYGINGTAVHPTDRAIPGLTPPVRLPVFAKDGSILPPLPNGTHR